MFILAYIYIRTHIFARVPPGKSYSMMGSAQDPGIIPRVCRALFYMIGRQAEDSGARSYTVEASYLEIYNEVRSEYV